MHRCSVLKVWRKYVQYFSRHCANNVREARTDRQRERQTDSRTARKHNDSVSGRIAYVAGTRKKERYIEAEVTEQRRYDPSVSAVFRVSAASTVARCRRASIQGAANKFCRGSGGEQGH